MESCSSIVNDNKLQLINTNNDQINNEIKNNENNGMALSPLLFDNENNEKRLINSPSTSSLLSEKEFKEIEKAYQIADDIKSRKIQRIDPTRFLHSLPDGAYPQLPKLKKYTTIYTSNIIFPLSNENDDQLQASSLNHDNKNTKLNIPNLNTDNIVTDKITGENENIKLSSNDINKNKNNIMNCDVKRDFNNFSSNDDNNKIEIDKTYKNLMPKFTDMVKVKKINFSMIMDVLNGKRTNMLYERHATIIEKLKDEYIPWLIDIINTLRQKIQHGGDILVKPLINLIESINNFSDHNKNDIPIPPIDPPILSKPLSQEALNIYFNLYYFKQSTKSLQIIGQS
ncbi:hypothetical protein PIROE2DRAFT_8761 [Piromyces sp. E2]|nr:hypothetical protein PIROE2DRAFT_8761 [Piromyces sp. E2]|eukprot:OUM64454.1 hypothetical protein PIROE2DRAFT_8761 [Piromyces sp. E2]